MEIIDFIKNQKFMVIWFSSLVFASKFFFFVVVFNMNCESEENDKLIKSTTN